MLSCGMARSRPTHGVYAPLFELAKGGMGRVDLVVRREGRFERLFAMKRLRPELRDDREVQAMFLEEARVAGLLRHPNVVSVLELGSDDEGPFLVMEYVESVSVATLLAEAKGVQLPVPLCLSIAMDVANGLHAAHELVGPDKTPLCLVHRDVSPANILVGFDGVARLTDFGIARAHDRSQRTTTGWLKGKIRYMAPEQLRFEELDRRTDLFALGIVLFELLSGQRLYPSADPADAARRILSEPAPDLADHRADAEPELVELLFELLAKSKEARPSTARDVARRLEAMLSIHRADADVARVDDHLERTFAVQRHAIQDEIVRARGELRASERRSRGRPFVILAGAALGALVLSSGAFVALRAARPEANASSIAAVPEGLPSAHGPPSAGVPVGATAASAAPPASASSELAATTAHAPKPSSAPVGARRAPAGGGRPPSARTGPPSSAGTAASGKVPLWEHYD